MKNLKYPFFLVLILEIFIVLLRAEIDTIKNLEISVKPHRYWLQFDPHLENNKFTFDGIVMIDFSLNDSSIIVLESNNLTIIENKTYLETISLWGWRNVPVKHEYNKNNIMLRINETSVSNYYRLSLTFVGILNNNNIGFFRTKYIDLENKTRWIAATKFQPNYPQYAFPCFNNEKISKTQFQLTLKRNKNQTAWSSTSPIYHEIIDTNDGKILRSYDWSPFLSPNELVFIIGDDPNATCPIWTAPNINFIK